MFIQRRRLVRLKVPAFQPGDRAAIQRIRTLHNHVQAVILGVGLHVAAGDQLITAPDEAADGLARADRALVVLELAPVDLLRAQRTRDDLIRTGTAMTGHVLPLQHGIATSLLVLAALQNVYTVAEAVGLEAAQWPHPGTPILALAALGLITAHFELVDGILDKNIAAQLGLSERTAAGGAIAMGLHPRNDAVMAEKMPSRALMWVIQELEADRAVESLGDVSEEGPARLCLVCRQRRCRGRLLL